MTPKLTQDDWYVLFLSLILVAVLPGWLVVLLPLIPVVFIVLLGARFFRW